MNHINHMNHIETIIEGTQNISLFFIVGISLLVLISVLSKRARWVALPLLVCTLLMTTIVVFYHSFQVATLVRTPAVLTASSNFLGTSVIDDPQSMEVEIGINDIGDEHENQTSSLPESEKPLWLTSFEQKKTSDLFVVARSGLYATEKEAEADALTKVQSQYQKLLAQTYSDFPVQMFSDASGIIPEVIAKHGGIQTYYDSHERDLGNGIVARMHQSTIAFPKTDEIIREIRQRFQDLSAMHRAITLAGGLGIGMMGLFILGTILSFWDRTVITTHPTEIQTG